MLIRATLVVLLLSPTVAFAQEIEAGSEALGVAKNDLAALKARQAEQSESTTNLLGFAKPRAKPVVINNTSVVKTEAKPKSEKKRRFIRGW